MELRIPSGSSALLNRNNEIRRRSGGLQPPELENTHTSGSRSTSSPTSQPYRQLKSTPDLAQDNSHCLTTADDNNITFLSKKLPTSIEDSAGMLAPPIENNIFDSRQSKTTRPLEGPVGRAERPLPPLPNLLETLGQEKNDTNDQGTYFASIPLTPRPNGPSHLESHASHISKASQRSVFSIFPRLPTPDFSVFKRKPPLKSVIAPLSFIRSRTSSISPDLSNSSRPSRFHAFSTESVGTARLSARPSNSSSKPGGDTRDPVRTESFRSTHSSETSDTLYDDEPHPSLLVGTPLRFTRKFPLPASIRYGRSLSDTHAFSRPGPFGGWISFGIGKVRRWTGHKWCLLLSVLTVSTIPVASDFPFY